MEKRALCVNYEAGFFALSRLKHEFDSRRGHHISMGYAATALRGFGPRARRHRPQLFPARIRPLALDPLRNVPRHALPE